MHIDFPAFLASLRYMGQGMLGIFAVMGLITTTVAIFTRAAK